MILWHFTRRGEFSKGLMCLSTSGNDTHYDLLKVMI